MLLKSTTNFAKNIISFQKICVMKNFIASIALIAMSANVFAQSCQNGNFEDWTNRSYSTLDSGWYSSNASSMAMHDTLTAKSVPGFSGQGIHLQTAIMGLDTMFGYITNSYGDPMRGIGGVPYTQKPTAITGYYRYSLPVNDSATILVEFKKSGAIVSTDRFMIRNATGSLSTFTPFTYTLSLAIVPDTVIIAIASSNVFGAGTQSGSWIEVDELSFTGTGVTQTIPDGNFESWFSQNMYMPNNWSTQTNFIPGVFQSTDRYQGNYSIELVNIPATGGSNPVETGFVTSGQLSGHNGPHGGTPYTMLVDTLTGYYKYVPVGADTAYVNLNLSAGGFPLSGFGEVLLPVSTWTYFEIPFSVTTAPDTIRIDFYSGGMTSHPGSSLKVDHLQLKSQPLPPVSILDMDNSENNVLLYPSPTTDNLNIRFKNPVMDNTSVVITDLLGRQILSQNYLINSNELKVETSQLQKGFFNIEIHNRNYYFIGRFVKG